MKKLVLAMAVFTFAVWLSTSSLLLSCLKATAAIDNNVVAIGIDDESTQFKPVEFSAEVSLDDFNSRSTKLDVNVIEKLDQAKQDMMKVGASKKPATVH